MIYLVFMMFISSFFFYAFGRSAPSLFKSIPAFFLGILTGIILSFIQYGLYGLFDFNPSSVLFKALENVLFDGFLPLAFAAVLNCLFFSSAMASGEPGGFAGWFVPQFFGLFSIYVPYSILKRYSPADSWFLFFFSFSSVLAVFLLRAVFMRSNTGFVRDPLDLFKAIILPFVSLACYSVLTAFWYFAMPPFIFISVSAGFLFVVLVASLLIGRKKQKDF